MLTKYIKFSFLASLFLFLSCDLIYDNYLANDDDEYHGWSCNRSILINSFDKAVNQCTYTVKYSNDLYDLRGRFQFTFKNSNKSYHLYSDEIILNKGQHQVNLFLSQCKFNDKITEVCFMVYK